MKKGVFTAIAVLGLAAAIPAQARVIYDSISGTTIAGADGSFDGNSIMANSFYFANPSAGAISSVTLGLGSTGSTGNSLMVYLTPDIGPSDVAGVPSGPDLANAVQIGSISDSALSTIIGTPSLITFSVPTAVSDALVAATFNNELWVVAVGQQTGSPASDAYWYFNDGTVMGVGADGQAHGNPLQGVMFNTLSEGPYQLTVEQVPEPISIAIMGIGLAGLGIVRRLRNQKSRSWLRLPAGSEAAPTIVSNGAAS